MAGICAAVVFASCAAVTDGLAAIPKIGGARNITVVLNGEPKSGTTWLEYVAKEMLTQACDKRRRCQLSFNADGRTLTAKKASSMVSYSMDEKHTIPNVGHVNKFDLSHPPTLSDDDVERAARKTLQEADEGKKWLVIFRDPRDVTISSCYHMYKNCPNANGFVASKIQTISGWINLRYRLFEALRRMAPDRVMMLFYEDMKKDELGTVKSLAGFFEMDLKRRESKLISQHTTFSAMKEKPKSQVAQGGAASGKVREGSSCGYLKELSADAAQRVTKSMRNVLEPLLDAKWRC